MLLSQIIILICIFLVVRFFRSISLRGWFLFGLSLTTLFWFQPVSTIRTLDFWLPCVSIFLSVIIWIGIYGKEILLEKINISSLFFIPLFILCLVSLRYLQSGWLSKFISLPSISPVLFFVAGFILLGIWVWNINKNSRYFWSLVIIALISLLVIQKFPPFSLAASKLLRNIGGQSLALASSNEIIWIGYSYFAFRLIHIVIERTRIKERKIALKEFMIYLFFPPSLIAGPIDSLFHFNDELNTSRGEENQKDMFNAGMRIGKGMFYKFILADSLALLALQPGISQKVGNPLWLWLLLYSYSFRIFFDFAGYTDIAIGLSMIIGIKLPENFNRPYLSRNITLFWNRWHITLTQWFRTYFFNPVVRYMRSKNTLIPDWVLIIFAQISTMILIGLWHGINWNFVFWGLWNGAGLFLHNRWSNFSKYIKEKYEERKVILKIYEVFSIILTFNFIALGWVWFAMPSLDESLEIFTKLLQFL